MRRRFRDSGFSRRWKMLLARLDAYERLIRLDKPIGILLLLWPTFWALWLATKGSPHWLLIVIFLVGTVLMRSAGCAINDYADRNFDAHVKRTQARPLAAGEIFPWEALALAAGLALCAFLLILPLNRLVIWLSLPAVIVAAAYPFFKRFFSVPQAVLGIAFSFGIPMAFAAVGPTIPAVCWWLFAANFFWVIAYDTAYAMVDRDDDIKLGLKTSAIWFGEYDVAAVMMSYAIFIVLMVVVGRLEQMGPIYYGALGISLALALYCYFLIRRGDRESCFKAFLQNHWIGAAIFAGIVADFAVRLRAVPRLT